MDLATTKALLRQHRVRPNKLRGQNFLVSDRAAGKIVEAADIRPEETVLEIGPGLGALTSGLLDRARRVVAVEIDRRLCQVLHDRFGGRSSLEIIHGDFLDVDLFPLAGQAGAGELKIVGNLPYQITGQAVRRILDHLHLLAGAVITVQREVANRMVAGPGGKTFGILSVATQVLSRPEPVLRLAREAFYPRPQITSTVVRLVPRPDPPVAIDDQGFFFTVVKALFGHRRKTIRNALRAHPDLCSDNHVLAELSRRAGVDLGRRAETMSLEELGRLSNTLGALRHAES